LLTASKVIHDSNRQHRLCGRLEDLGEPYRTARREHGVDIVSGQLTTCEAGEAQGWRKLISSSSEK
jgi:hypothetical protein